MCLKMKVKTFGDEFRLHPLRLPLESLRTDPGCPYKHTLKLLQYYNLKILQILPIDRTTLFQRIPGEGKIEDLEVNILDLKSLCGS